jgi:hypothetical protein
MPDGPVDFHLVVHSEIVIESSPAVIWEFLDRPREWKPSIVSIERHGGQPGQAGETLRIGQRPAGETVYVTMRTLRADPPRRRVQTLATVAGRQTDGFVIYALEPAGAATRLVCDVVARCEVDAAALGGATPAEFDRQVNEATARKLDADHRALKALVERS